MRALVPAAEDCRVGPTTTFSFLVYGGYYRHARVVTALGLEPRAPHPKDTRWAADDWSLLEQVRGRAGA